MLVSSLYAEPEMSLATRTIRITLAIGLLLLASAGSGRPALATSLRFEAQPFETQAHGSIAAEVAYLEVPLRHELTASATTRLRVVRLPATGGALKAAPVVYLAGGPGGSGVGTARGPRWTVFDRVRREADVLLLDQRGTGLSEPPPACPHHHDFDASQPLQPEAAINALRDSARRCIQHWREAGIDLEAYTTLQSAHDLEALRQALGVPRLSLWGMSYGTHLALAYLRSYEARVERIVLIGTEGPDQQLKLPLSADALLADLAEIAEAQGHADLVGATRRVLTALREQPASGHSLLRGQTVQIGEFDAQLAVAAALGRRSTQRLLPLALRQAEAGDYDLLVELVLAVREHLAEFQAMPLVMDVASGQSPARRQRVEAEAGQSMFGNALNFPFPAFADGLGLPDLGESFRGPLVSSVPSLFISGTLDGRTPPANVDELTPGFSRATELLVQNASHDDELWLGHPAIAEAIADFLGGRDVQPQRIPVDAPQFATSTVGLLIEAIGAGRLFGALALLLGVLVTPVVVWRRRRARRQRGA